MANRSYCSLDALKMEMGDTLKDDDKAYRRILEAATEWIEYETRRIFQPYLATRVYTAKHGERLDIDDLLSITTLKTDDDDDYDYDTATFATTDYFLMPFNAPDILEPYTRLKTKPNGRYAFPTNEQGIEIVGKWGYWETLEMPTSLVNDADVTATETTLTVDNGEDFDVLDTILIDSEQMYITNISVNLLTVVRAVNGTTGATHVDNSVIKIYRYPERIRRATLLRTIRLEKRTDSPFGIQGFQDGSGMKIPTEDPDIVTLIRGYRKLQIA